MRQFFVALLACAVGCTTEAGTIYSRWTTNADSVEINGNTLTNIQLSGIQQGGAASGQFLGWSGFGWQPMSISISNLPSNVITNTETGVTLGGTFTGTFNGNATSATTATLANNVAAGISITNENQYGTVTLESAATFTNGTSGLGIANGIYYGNGSGLSDVTALIVGSLLTNATFMGTLTNESIFGPTTNQIIEGVTTNWTNLSARQCRLTMVFSAGGSAFSEQVVQSNNASSVITNEVFVPAGTDAYGTLALECESNTVVILTSENGSPQCQYSAVTYH